MRPRGIFLAFLLVLNVFLGYRLVAGDTGLLAYFELRDRYRQMERRLAEADDRSRDLSREIRLLRTDREYLEGRIRVRMNYVGEGETLYLFPDEAQPGASQDSLGAAQDDDKN